MLLGYCLTYSQGYEGKGRVKGIIMDQDGNPVGGVTVKLYSLKGASYDIDFQDALYYLGLVNLTLGNNQEAVDVFHEYLKYDKESDRAGQVRNFIEFLKKK